MVDIEKNIDVYLCAIMIMVGFEVDHNVICGEQEVVLHFALY